MCLPAASHGNALSRKAAVDLSDAAVLMLGQVRSNVQHLYPQNLVGVLHDTVTLACYQNKKKLGKHLTSM